MSLGSGEESPSWALRAAGSEQGFVFIKGRHQSHVQDLQGLEEFSLLVSALLMGPDGFTWNSCFPLHLGPSAHFPSLLSAGRRGWEAPKLPTEKHPKLHFTRLICGGAGCGQPQILSRAFPNLLQPDPSCSIPTSAARMFGLPAERAPVLVGVGSPFPAPPSMSQIPSARGVCLQLPVPAVGLSSLS